MRCINFISGNDNSQLAVGRDEEIKEKLISANGVFHKTQYSALQKNKKRFQGSGKEDIENDTEVTENGNTN